MAEWGWGSDVCSPVHAPSTKVNPHEEARGRDREEVDQRVSEINVWRQNTAPLEPGPDPGFLFLFLILVSE